MSKKITPEFKEPLLPGMLLRVHNDVNGKSFYALGEIVVVLALSETQRADIGDRTGLLLPIMSQSDTCSRYICTARHERARWIYALEVLDEDDVTATDLLLLMEESTPQFREALQNNGRLSSDD